MALRVSEAIQRLMGWCPNAAAAGTVRRYAALDDEIGMAAGGSPEVVEGALGTPAIYLILIVGGALLIGCLAVTALAGRLLLLTIILAFSGAELYRILRRARVEISSDAITIRRPLFRPIVIPKDAVVKAEVGENRLPVPFWILATALAALLVSAAAGIYFGWDNPTSMRFIFGFGGAIFFPVIQALVITTTKKRIAVIYTDDPERIARMLGVAG